MKTYWLPTKRESTHCYWALLSFTRQKLSSFHRFASSVISLDTKVAEVRAFGSDGEPELIMAFSLAFRNAVQLRCFSHFRQYIKDELREVNMLQLATKKSLRIFLENYLAVISRKALWMLKLM